jgi:hypothetical protein
MSVLAAVVVMMEAGRGGSWRVIGGARLRRGKKLRVLWKERRS